MWKWKLWALLGFAFGIAGLGWGYAQQQKASGFFELRVYTALPYISRLHADPQRSIVSRAQTLARRCSSELQPSTSRQVRTSDPGRCPTDYGRACERWWPPCGDSSSGLTWTLASELL